MADETDAPYGYKPDDPYVTCARSGWKFRLSDTVIEWTGLRVGQRFAEPKHPSLDIPSDIYQAEEIIEDPTGPQQDNLLEESITDWSTLG